MRHIFIALSLLGCSHSTDAARRAITSAAQLGAEVSRLFVAADGPHQKRIASEAKTEADGVMALHAYRLKRDVFVSALEHYKSAVATAPLILDLVDRGVKKPADLDKWLHDILETGLALRDMLRKLHGRAP